MCGEEEECTYVPPPTCDLLGLLLKNRRPTGGVNQVWPGLYLSNTTVAKDKGVLLNLGVTHVVNAAHGPERIDTGPGYYDDTGVTYLGVEADDRKEFNMSLYFHETADFIHDALTHDGKVLVHCARGVSRSATLVLAYLMIKVGLTLVDAVETVKKHRNILPNVGFLNQLQELDLLLHQQRRGNICYMKDDCVRD